MSALDMPRRVVALVQRHPVTAYFAMTFTISWTSALLVAAPHLLRHEPLAKLTAILMFPVMLVGPSLSGLVLTRIVDGRTGIRDLRSRIFAVRASVRWYAVLAIPPFLVLSVLLFLNTFVSPAYAPNRFFIGILFGVPAGLLEELGWMGYAFPKMRLQNNWLVSSVLLGLLWGLWHLPVVDYLGAASPHGVYWLRFFLAFTFVMTAMRVLITWLYENTKSIFLTQLMHISSTASLVIFSAPRVTAAQEVFWYAIYGAALWVLAAIIALAVRQRLRPRNAHGISEISSKENPKQRSWDSA